MDIAGIISNFNGIAQMQPEKWQVPVVSNNRLPRLSRMSISHKLIITALALLLTNPAAASTCSAESGKSRVALLELYTSEGCDSCPSTDRWFSRLPQRGYTPQQVLALAFHVDYWNYLGWKDPYAQAQFSARQREASRRNQARVVYTPQLLLDGTDYRRGMFDDDLGRRINAGKAPGAQISMSIDTRDTQPRLRARISTVSDSVQAYAAIYENNLVTEVAAGENRGKRLRHDFVVRELYGPFAVTVATPLNLDQVIRKDRVWKTADLHIAVFVQDTRTGAALQALDLPWCSTGQSRML